MTDSVIEKGVPIPPPRRRFGWAALLRKLEIGDSVVLPTANWRANSAASRVLGKGHYRSAKEATGTRIWRIG